MEICMALEQSVTQGTIERVLVYTEVGKQKDEGRNPQSNFTFTRILVTCTIATIAKLHILRAVDFRTCEGRTPVTLKFLQTKGLHLYFKIPSVSVNSWRNIGERGSTECPKNMILPTCLYLVDCYCLLDHSGKPRSKLCASFFVNLT